MTTPNAVIASTIISRVGFWSCTLVAPISEVPEILRACGVKSTCLPRSGMAFLLHQCVYTAALRHRTVAILSWRPSSSSWVWS